MIPYPAHFQWGWSQSQLPRAQIHRETRSKNVTVQMPPDNCFKKRAKGQKPLHVIFWAWIWFVKLLRPTRCFLNETRLETLGDFAGQIMCEVLIVVLMMEMSSEKRFQLRKEVPDAVLKVQRCWWDVDTGETGDTDASEAKEQPRWICRRARKRPEINSCEGNPSSLWS